MPARVRLAPSLQTTHHPLMCQLSRAKAAHWLLGEILEGEQWGFLSYIPKSLVAEGVRG